MKLNKWNYKTKQYEPFASPVVAPRLIADLDTIIQCTNCGNPLEYGCSYTSRTIHTDIGLGYPVCNECYKQEFEEENTY